MYEDSRMENDYYFTLHYKVSNSLQHTVPINTKFLLTPWAIHVGEDTWLHQQVFITFFLSSWNPLQTPVMSVLVFPRPPSFWLRLCYFLQLTFLFSFQYMPIVYVFILFHLSHLHYCCKVFDLVVTFYSLFSLF